MLVPSAARKFLFSSVLFVFCLAGCGPASDALLSNARVDNDPVSKAPLSASGVVHPVQNASICLDVAGGNTANGTAVQIAWCNGGSAQQWTVSGNTVRVFGNKCLDVPNGNNANGTKLQIWDCVNNTNQQWVISGQTLVWTQGNKCLDIPGDNVRDGMRVQTYACNGTQAQQWTLPSGTTTPSSSCKRGIAYGGNSVADLTTLSKGISWWYNWSPQPENGAVANAYPGLGLSFAPMVWNGSFNVNTVLSEMPTTNVNVLLTFNEPNFNNQANLTPQQAAALWPQIEQIAQARGMKIASPALNYCGGGCNETDPFAWFDAFFAACNNCQVDYLALHWYACTGDALTWYLNQMESRYGRKVWLTEFACLDTSDVSVPAQQAYMAAALQILENDANVMRYAWFTGRFPNQGAVNLLGADGQLTALGAQYVNAPQSCR